MLTLFSKPEIIFPFDYSCNEVIHSHGQEDCLDCSIIEDSNAKGLDTVEFCFYRGKTYFLSIGREIDDSKENGGISFEDLLVDWKFYNDYEDEIKSLEKIVNYYRELNKYVNNITKKG